LGISGKDYNALNTSKDLPMFNRAIQGQYPPGSTLKPMLGLGGLESGAITTETTVNDPGYYQLENDDRLYRDWLRTGHGHKVDLFQAIVQSCDVFFYGLGNKMGVDRMHPFGLPFGLGARTNIDIPSERKGLWPSREWKKKVRNLAWYPGNSLNMSLGQGDVLATPLQLALMTSTLARKGTLIEPRLVEKIDGEQVPRVVRNEYQPTEEHWQYVINAMTAVVHSSRGTARSIAKKINYKMAGKTGTAQLVSIAQGEKYDSDALSERNRDNALFVAFAPAENPKIAVSVMIENAERSSHAVKVATAVISEYLSNLPVETLNTKTSYDTDNSLASTMLLSTTMSVSSHVSSVSIIDNGVESRAE
jgi:penicillin-binding protein 2